MGHANGTVFKVIRSWASGAKRREAADQIYLMLLQRLQQTRDPLQGIEIDKNAESAQLARLIQRKYPHMVVKIWPTKISFALAAQFFAGTTPETRDLLEKSGFLGAKAVEAFADAAARLEEAGEKMPVSGLGGLDAHSVASPTTEDLNATPAILDRKRGVK